MSELALKVPQDPGPFLSSFGFPEVRAGSLSVRLAMDTLDIEASQRLRYRIFCGEMGGIPSEEGMRLKRDFDVFDTLCDHLLVVDEDLAQPIQVVGTYRLLRRELMEVAGNYYTEGEYDISRLKSLQDAALLELGRACVDEGYRKRAVIQLLLRGIVAYVTMHGITHMFGCAVFSGTNPRAHAEALSYLHHHHLAHATIRPCALPHLAHSMNFLPAKDINTRRAFVNLPALVKGYLRVGGFIGDGAVVDKNCNTVSVCVVVPTASICRQYRRRYASEDVPGDA